jgi:CDP-6-deoxy-D-xylo-4-hexulose-3-dehydrase
MLLPFYVNGDKSAEKKKLIVKALEEAEVETRPVLTGNFLSQPAMKTIAKGRQAPEDFPIATMVTDTGFMVGAHHDLEVEQIEYLCESLKIVAQKFS